MRDCFRCPLLLLLAVLSTAAIFAFDYAMPLGVAGGVPYALLVLLGLITRRTRDVVVLAILGTLLTVSGYYFSRPGVDQSLVLINRGLALFSIWSVAAVLACHFSSLAKLSRQATMDQVTGLFNRHCFFAEGAQSVNNWRRYHTPLSLILFDLDDFKQINDKYGHETGDKVLQRIAVICRGCVRDTDIPARIGGEEFAILMPSTTVNGAHVIATRIQQEIAAMSVPDQDPLVRVTASIGIVQMQDEYGELSDLLRAADKLLYEAKERGKNRVIFSGPAMGPQNSFPTA